MLIAFVVGVVSCRPADERPRPRISQETFVDILLDMHLATTAKQMNLLHALDTLKKDRIQTMILDKHEVKKVDLLYAIDYYSAMPDSMAYFYNKMIEKLSAKQAELGNK